MEKLSAQAEDDLRFLGNFKLATGNCFKGYMVDDDGDVSKVYLHESDFRNLAKSCQEIADWLAGHGNK